MTQEQIQNVLISLLAAGLIMLGVGIYLVSLQAQNVQTGLNNIQLNISDLKSGATK